MRLVILPVQGDTPPCRGCRKRDGAGAIVIDGKGIGLDVHSEVVRVLEETLNLKRTGVRMTSDSPLLGAIPELDSMAVVALITTLEERFGFVVADDEIDGATFATAGTLVAFVESKLGA